MTQQTSAARRPFFPPASRVLLGCVIVLLTIGGTYLRTTRISQAINTATALDSANTVRPVSSAALANARYHAAHARAEREARWDITGYATIAIIGTGIGMILVASGIRRPAV